MPLKAIITPEQNGTYAAPFSSRRSRINNHPRTDRSPYAEDNE
jgi:hypothetical protein